jgi:hypothetical protein
LAAGDVSSSVAGHVRRCGVLKFALDHWRAPTSTETVGQRTEEFVRVGLLENQFVDLLERVAVGGLGDVEGLPPGA